MPWYLRKLMVRGGFMDAADDNGGAGTGGAATGGDGGANGDAGKGTGDDGAGGGTGNGAGTAGAGEGDDTKGGAPKPTDAEAKLLKELMGKKTALKDAQAKLDAAAAVTKQIEEMGGLEAVRALVDEKREKEQKALEDKGQWDKLRAQMVEQHTKELGDKDTAAKTLADENVTLKKTIAELTVGNAFVSSQFIKEDLTIPQSKVRLLYGSHFEFQDGAVVAYDKPAGASDRTMLIDGKGDPLGFEAAIKKIIDADPDRDQMMKTKMRPGAGSLSSGKGAPPDTKQTQKTGIDKIAEGLTKGLLKK